MFEAGGTAYIVTERVEGRTLSAEAKAPPFRSLIRSRVVKKIALRDLRARAQDAYVREETLLTANNGRPVAVLLPVEADTVDETLEVVRRARGLEALRAIRRASQTTGAARMTPADIDALVTRTRCSRPR